MKINKLLLFIILLILLSSTAFASNQIYSVSNQSSYNHHVSDNSIYSNQIIHNHTNNLEYNKDNSAINSNKSITSKKNTKLNHDSINTSIINSSKNNYINNKIISINSNNSTNSSTKIIKTSTNSLDEVYVSKTGQDSNTGNSSSPKATIREALRIVNDGGTIYLDNGTYTEYNITISKNINIHGNSSNNVIINGKQNHIFTIGNGSKVTFHALTITNGVANNSSLNYDIGGAILNEGNLMLDSVKITSSHASYGGGIFNNGILIAKKSTFKGNTASSKGGAIYNNGTLNMTRCTYDKNIISEGNTIYYGGSAIYSRGIIYLSDNNFTNNNHSPIFIKSIHYVELNTITSCIFTNINRTTSCIFCSYTKLFLSNSIFKNNHASEYSEIIYSESSTINMENNTFMNNSGDNNHLITSFFSDVAINNLTCENNSCNNPNGVFYIIKSNIQLNNSIIKNNINKNNSIINFKSGNLSILNSNITNNSAKENIIYSNNSIININESNINNNTVNKYGSIYTTNSSINIDDSRLCNNHATMGGAIYSIDSDIEINNTIFSSNHAKCGGAIFHMGNTLLNINNSSFYNNTATVYEGGAIYGMYPYLYIESSNFTNNYANTTGGAISLESSDLSSIEKSIFLNNTANKIGTAVNIKRGNFDLTNNVIISNTNKNLISFDDSSIYNINDNWWGVNNPDFKIVTNNIVPETWYVMQVTNTITNNTRKIKITLNTLNTGKVIKYTLPTRQLIIQLSGTTKTYNIQDNLEYITTNLEDEITTKIDNQIVPSNTKLEPDFKSNNITVKPGSTIILTAHINKDITGKTCIKINDVTLKDENNLPLYIRPDNGLIQHKFTVPFTWTGIYKVTFVYGGNSKYQEKRININMTIASKNQTIEKTIISTKKNPIIESNDQIAIPGKTIILKAKINNDITGNITIKIDGTTISSVIINKGTIQYNYKVPTTWNNSYYTIKKVQYTYKGNSNYNAKTINTNLYIQQNNNTFDLRKYHLVTDVRDQGASGSCWAFGTYGALESNILKSLNKTIDLSENNIKNIISKNSYDGINREPNTGRSALSSISYLISWLGPIKENRDPYDEYSIFSPTLVPDLHIQNVIFVPDRKNCTDNNLIKEMILKYGAVETVIYAQFDGDNWYCNNPSLGTTHSVAIIGWDDNYSKNNFEYNGTRPEGNGAFIIKNSWGKNFDKKGYVYISYYDKTLAGINIQNNRNNYVFVLNDTVNYSNIYQNTKLSGDAIDLNYSSTVWVKNNYESLNNESIKAVGTFFLNPSNCTIYIYKNNKLQYIQNNTIKSIGYKTIELDSTIPLEKNDNITTVVKIQNIDNFPTYIVVQDLIESINKSYTNNSYISTNGNNWIPLSQYKYIACLNTYTIKTNQNIKVNTSLNNTTLEVTTKIISNNITNATINFYINNKLVKKITNIKINTITTNLNLSSIDSRNLTLCVQVINKNEIINQTLTIYKPGNYTKTQILTAANNFRNFVSNNNRLPNYVTVKEDKLSVNDFLYLTCKTLYNSSIITLNNNYFHTKTTTTTNCYYEQINKEDYLKIAKNIIESYEIYGTNPDKITYDTYNLSFEDAAYLFSGISQFEKTNSRLPNYATVRDYQVCYNRQSINITTASRTCYVNETITLIANFTYLNNHKVNGLNATFIIDGVTISTAPIINGVAKITYTPKTVKTSNLLIKTFRTTEYNSANTTATLNMIKKATKIISNSWIITNNTIVNITSTVKDANNHTITQGTLNYTMNNQKIGLSKIINGTSKLSFKVNTTGINKITITYNENDLCKGSNLTVYLRITENMKKYTYSQVLESAHWTKINIKNNKLPNNINITNENITTTDYLFLLCNLVTNNNTYYNGKFNNTTTYTTTSCTQTTINKTEYKSLANILLNSYKTIGKTPTIIKSNFGYLSYNDTIYLYTQIVDYLYQNKKLPETIKITSLTKTSCETPIDYNITIPCYTNITLPTVIKINNTQYDKYIIKTGTNGIIKIPNTRIINITFIETNKTYTLSNKNITNFIHNLGKTACFITKDGKMNCSITYPSIKEGLLIYTQNDNIIIKYHNNLINNINQFSIISSAISKTYDNNSLPRINNSLYAEQMIINVNNKNRTKILFTEGINYDDTGLKYQIYKQTKQTANFETITYTKLMANYPRINYTTTKERVNYSSNKLLKNNLTEYILTQFQCNRLQISKQEKIKYQNSIYNKTIDTIQTYTATKIKINNTIIDEWINKNSTYKNNAIYQTFYKGLEFLYLADTFANTIEKITNTNTSWYRNTTTIILTYTNTNKLDLEVLDSSLAITIQTTNNTNKESFENIIKIVIPLIYQQTMNYTEINLTDILENSNMSQVLYNFTESSPINNTPAPTVNGTEIIDSISDYSKSDLYKQWNKDENETILGFKLDSKWAQYEQMIGNVLITAGFILMPAIGPYSFPLIATGLFLDADGKGCFAQEYNMSRYGRVLIDTLNDYSFGELGVFGNVVFHGAITYVGESFLQATTGKTDEELGIDIFLNSLPSKSTMLDKNMVKSIKTVIKTDESKRTIIKILEGDYKINKENTIISLITSYVVANEKLGSKMLKDSLKILINHISPSENRSETLT